MASIMFASTDGGEDFLPKDSKQNVKKNQQKFFLISIHKPPAANQSAPIQDTLAGTAEPFKFSPAEPAAYELRYM